MEPAPPRKQRSRREDRQEGSIVAEVEKAAVLAMVDQMEAEAVRKEEVLAIAHDENVSAWIEAISQSLRVTAAERVSLTQLCQCLTLSPVEVWLAVLLSGFELEPEGMFYSQDLWVKAVAGSSFRSAIARF